MGDGSETGGPISDSGSVPFIPAFPPTSCGGLSIDTSVPLESVDSQSLFSQFWSQRQPSQTKPFGV